MLYYSNVQLFDNVLVTVALIPVRLVIAARFNIAVFLILHYLMLNYFNVALF